MSELPEWLGEAALQQFFASTKAAGGEARAVGGCVRDFLIGREAGDVDVASTLPPEKTIDIAAQHGWKAVPTGIAHGTVTLVLPQRILEVTTLRRDVATDGRHATVAYTDNWQEDAARRDFTMNALYMDAAGEITDFFNGRTDITAQRVCFIGDAGTRIAEDGLRMLRYFRFLASHGKPPADEAALAAIAAHKHMLTDLSGERIAAEMRKLLTVENPAFALRLLQQSGIAPFIFPCEIIPQRMIRLHMLEVQAGYQTSVWARLVAILHSACHPGLVPGSGGEASAASSVEPSPSTGRIPAQGRDDKVKGIVPWLVERWKLSRHEGDQLRLLTGLPPFAAESPRHVHTRLIRLHGAPAYLDWLLTQAAAQPGMALAPYVALAHEFVVPVFPVTASDLMARGMTQGKALGDALAALEKVWEASDYTLTKAALLTV